MTFFPNQVMPKTLKRESNKEVDNSPLVYNARDYNVHHREIRAIQELLIGIVDASGSSNSGTGDGTTPGSGSTPGNEATGGGGNDGGMTIIDALIRFSEIIELIATQGFSGLYSGTVQANGSVPISSEIIQTQTEGTVLSSDATVSVVSTAGFPSSGIITKFNKLDIGETCSDGSAPGGGSRCALGSQKILTYNGLIVSGSHATNQEIITYTSKTATSFLGCTRSVNGSTAQTATPTGPALILNGRAAMSLGHNFWGRSQTGSPNQFIINHDAMLKTSATLRAKGSRTRQGIVLEDHIEISWLLSYVGNFESVDVSQIFNPTG